MDPRAYFDKVARQQTGGPVLPEAATGDMLEFEFRNAPDLTVIAFPASTLAAVHLRPEGEGEPAPAAVLEFHNHRVVLRDGGASVLRCWRAGTLRRVVCDPTWRGKETNATGDTVTVQAMQYDLLREDFSDPTDDGEA